MPTKKLTIFIVPSISLNLIHGWKPEEYGDTFSTKDNINVNYAVDGYSILYMDNEFELINVEATVREIRNIFITEAGTDVSVVMEYLFYSAINPEDPEFFYNGAGIKVLEMANELMRSSTPKFQYTVTDSVNKTRELIDDEMRKMGIDLRWRKKEKQAETANRNPPTHDDFYLNFGSMPDTSYRGNKKKKGKKKKSSKPRSSTSSRSYGRSKVITNSKHPKKEFDRHGVVISRDKDDRERDRKMIKSFLKSFIPGDERWKREFRSDLLDRWMDAFTVSKKRLHKLEKKMKKHKKNKKKKMSPGKAIAMNISKQIMAASTDPWSNPNM